jgi:2-phosphoglycerate kinase
VILEGAHLVPGFLEKVDSDDAVIVPLLVTIDDENLHRGHFYRRDRDTGSRGSERYLKAFKKIRKIQKYMVSSALMRGVPTISHYDLDATLTQIIDHVITKALESLARGVVVKDTEDKLLERAVEAVGRQKKEGSDKHEAVS